MEIRFDDKLIGYSGRIGFEEDGAHFYYAASSAQVKFRGTELSLEICAKNAWGTNSLGYIIDGRMAKLPFKPENDGKFVTIKAASCLEADSEHTFMLYKRAAGNHSFTVKSISCDGEFLPDDRKFDLNLEFYGDSVSAGEVCEAVDFVGRCDPENHDSSFDNSYMSYTWQTARILNADIQNIAQGGIAVFDDTGYFHWPKMIGMESVYDKLCYFPEAGEISEWDFSRYTPDVIVFALGQNDKHNGITDKDDIDIYDPAVRTKWKNGYKDIARSIWEKYGRTPKLIFITTLLMHDPEWDKAIGEVSDELCAEGIKAYHKLFARNGAATPGHPRIPEHTEMAEELSAFIRTII